MYFAVPAHKNARGGDIKSEEQARHRQIGAAASIYSEARRTAHSFVRQAQARELTTAHKTLSSDVT